MQHPKPAKLSDFGDDFDIQLRANRLFAEAPVGNVYTYFLDQSVEAPDDYRDLTLLLMTAKPEDTIKLIINGPGGQVDSAVQICNLIAACPALVEGHIVGDACSADAFIALACHSWVMYPTARIMIHSYSGGVIGSQQTIQSSVESSKRQIEHFIKMLASPFLTDEELHDVLNNGRDVWIHQDEFVERFERVVAFREQESKRIELAQLNAQMEAVQAAIATHNE